MKASVGIVGLVVVMALVVGLGVAVAEDQEGGSPVIPIGDQVGTIEQVKGEVTVWRNGQPLPAEAGMILYKNDEIRTAQDATADLGLNDEAKITLGALSTLSIEGFQPPTDDQPGITQLFFPNGRMRMIGGTHEIQTKTPTALLSTDGPKSGSDLIMSHVGVDTDVYVLARDVTVINRERSTEEPVNIKSCRQSTIRRDLAPSPPMPITAGMLATLFADASEIQAVAGSAAGVCTKRYGSPWKTLASPEPKPVSPSRP